MSKSTTACPTVNAYNPGPAILRKHPNLAAVWIVPQCPFCNRAHVHGANAGPRQSHCPPANSPHAYLLEGRDRPSAYKLVHAGEINDAKVFKKESVRLREKERAYVRSFRDRDLARRSASRSSS